MTDDADFLEHFGVKGMKWGVSKTPQNVDYSSGSRKYDRAMYGRSYTKNVNKNMNKGQGLKDARKTAGKREVKKAMTRVGIGLGLFTVAKFSPQIMRTVIAADRKAGDIAFDRFAKDGMKKAATILADSRGLTNYETIAGEFLKSR